MRNNFAHERETEASDLGMNGCLHIIVRAWVEREQRLNFSAQFRITVASFIEQGSTLARVAFRDAVKQILNLRPTLRIQVYLPALHFTLKPRFGHSQIASHGHWRNV